MENKRNINSVINARGLARKLIDADPYNEGKSLQVPNLMKMKFDEYLSTDNGGNFIPIVMSEEYVSDKALEFVHSTRGIPFTSAYRYPKFKGDLSQISFYNCCKRILSKDKDIGDCLGLSSVVKYLLDSKGIESRFVYYANHVALDLKIDGGSIYLESTRPDGLGHKESKKEINDVGIISLVKSNFGSALFEEEKFEEAVEYYNDLIRINPKNTFAYNTLGASLYYLTRFKDAILVSTKAINLSRNNDVAYLNRGSSYLRLKEWEKALKDYETYASFNKNNMKIVWKSIYGLKEKLKENKNG